MIEYNTGEGREEWVTRLGLVMFYPTLLVAIAGGVVLWRRRLRRVLWVLLTPAIVVTIGSAATYGQTRFRAAAEPSLALLAAFALSALWVWVKARRALDHHPGDRARTASAEPVAPVDAATP
jgi:hypothetical protein